MSIYERMKPYEKVAFPFMAAGVLGMVAGGATWAFGSAKVSDYEKQITLQRETVLDIKLSNPDKIINVSSDLSLEYETRSREYERTANIGKNIFYTSLAVAGLGFSAHFSPLLIPSFRRRRASPEGLEEAVN